MVDISLAAERRGKYSRLLIVLVYTKQKTLSKKADVKPFVNRSDEGLTLKTSAFLPFTVAN